MTEKRSMSILMVDDEEIIHLTLGDYLRDCGHRVEGIFEGAQALEAVKTRPYDLAMIDLRMLGMNGLDLLSGIRKYRPEMPVFVVTGHGSEDMKEEVMRFGRVQFLLKPVKLLELEAMLERIAGAAPSPEGSEPPAASRGRRKEKR